MAWIIAILTVILIVDCLLLVLLVLIQLPKKEAGLGTAFGGGTTDALFGAGTGNALTKMTKYATVVFFVLTLTLSMMRAHQSRAERDRFAKEVSEIEPQLPALPPGSVTNAPAEVTNSASPAAPQPTNPPTAPQQAPAEATPEAPAPAPAPQEPPEN